MSIGREVQSREDANARVERKDGRGTDKRGNGKRRDSLAPEVRSWPVASPRVVGIPADGSEAMTYRSGTV